MSDWLHPPRRDEPMKLPDEQLPEPDHAAIQRGLLWGLALGIPIWIVAALMIWAVHLRWFS